MSTESNLTGKSVLGRASALLRRRQEAAEQEWHVVDGYYVGDIMSDEPIRVASGAAVAGNVAAPSLSVQGLVYGFAAARALSIGQGGQIWGDVYCAQLQVSEGGKLHGWATTLDEGTVDLLRSGDLSSGDIPGQAGLSDLPADLGISSERLVAEEAMSLRWLGIWRQLQAEAAVAHLARQELEARFDARVAEIASDAMAEAASLRQELAMSGRTLASRQAAERATGSPELDESPDRLRRLQIALKRSLRRNAQLEAAVEYWRTLAGDGKEATESETALDTPGNSGAGSVQDSDTDKSSATLWGRVSESVANAQLAYSQTLLQAQGERVSELQAALAEREVALDRCQAELGDQRERLARLRKAAAERIGSLEAELERRGIPRLGS